MLAPDVLQLMNSAQEGIIVLDLQCRYVLWNPFMERLSGKLAREVLGKHPWEVFPFIQKKEFDIILEQTLRGETITTPDLTSNDSLERQIWVSRLTAPLRNASGEIIGVLKIIRDVTERKLAELRLAEAELPFRKLIEHSHEAIVVIDSNAKKLFVGAGISRITGHSAEEYIALEPFAAVHPDDREYAKETLSRLNRIPGQPIAAELRLLRKDGSVCWIELVATNLIDVPGIKGIVVNFRDINDRKRADEAMLAYQQQLQSLSSTLLRNEERQRRSFAQMLHDHIGQNLTFAKMKLSSLQFREMNSSSFVEIQELTKLVEQIIGQTRSLTYELSPPLLYEIGLDAALEWLGEHFQSRYGLLCHFEGSDGPERLGIDHRVILFQATRELLFNVVKHARAKSALISSMRTLETVRLTVRDDGAGFDPLKLSSSTGGFGLFSVRERIQNAGGKFEIISRVGSGTTVSMLLAIGA